MLTPQRSNYTTPSQPSQPSQPSPSEGQETLPQVEPDSERRITDSSFYPKAAQPTDVWPEFAEKKKKLRTFTVIGIPEPEDPIYVQGKRVRAQREFRSPRYNYKGKDRDQQLRDRWSPLWGCDLIYVPDKVIEHAEQGVYPHGSSDEEKWGDQRLDRRDPRMNRNMNHRSQENENAVITSADWGSMLPSVVAFTTTKRTDAGWGYLRSVCVKALRWTKSEPDSSLMDLIAVAKGLLPKHPDVVYPFSLPVYPAPSGFDPLVGPDAPEGALPTAAQWLRAQRVIAAEQLRGQDAAYSALTHTWPPYGNAFTWPAQQDTVDSDTMYTKGHEYSAPSTSYAKYVEWWNKRHGKNPKMQWSKPERWAPRRYYSVLPSPIMRPSVAMVAEPAPSHQFHVVHVSPMPILSAALGGCFVSAVVSAFSDAHASGMGFLMGTLTLITIAGLWWRDVSTEGSRMGDHVHEVVSMLHYGFILFVLTEVMLFASVFWAYLHNALSPAIEVGGLWPPQGVMAVEAEALPTLNTLLLIASGGAVTWAHHGLIMGQRAQVITGGIATVVLAVVFTWLQGLEYVDSPFTWSDSVYGCSFYMATGLHGLHVMVGTLFIVITSLRVAFYQSTESHHVGYELSIVYWHLVDVIWLLLYVLVYWWGG